MDGSNCMHWNETIGSKVPKLSDHSFQFTQAVGLGITRPDCNASQTMQKIVVVATNGSLLQPRHTYWAVTLRKYGNLQLVIIRKENKLYHCNMSVIYSLERLCWKHSFAPLALRSICGGSDSC